MSDEREQGNDRCANYVADVEAWIRRWPMHCRSCAGWGGSSFTQHHGYGHTENLFELCGAVPERTCHRCGEAGTLSEDGEGPCKSCAWSFDDGIPIF